MFIENIKTFDHILSITKDKLEKSAKYPYDHKQLLNEEDYSSLYTSVLSINSSSDINTNSIIHWNINYDETSIRINVSYDADLFKSTTIERFIKYYINILKAVFENKNINIYSIDILTEEESVLYTELNNTFSEYPIHVTIPKLFEDAVNNFPENIAISSNEGQYTYSELNTKANQLANGLLEKGLNKGDFVTIFMNRSLETIISILGIIKAGGVYVPLDPEHPEERNSYIVSDTKSPFIVTKATYENKAKDLLSNAQSVKEIILLESDIDNFSTENPVVNLKSDDLAYVIYTSGSTGKPKGTLIAHEGVVNLVYLIKEQFEIKETDILTQFATYSFDASVWDTFGSLCWGARLHLLSSEERMSADAFADAIYRTKATFIAILPTVFFNQIATYLSEENNYKFDTVKRVSVGGEALSGEIVRAFQRRFNNNIEIVNLYGPTESTVVATGYKIQGLIPEDQANIPIGKPFSNYQVYITNEENKLCPIGVPGELCISSVGLAKGYLHQEEKRNEVFVKNPFNEDGIIYKSGDIVRLLDNGLIEYVSRKDSQVKVNGHRIEISEIEDNFAKHPEVRDVAIIPKKINDETILIAYYTNTTDKTVETSEIKEFLGETLPHYMIPKHIYVLEEMPISPTGKIDRKKLATYEIVKTEENTDYVAPENEVQEIIADSWQKTLKLDKVSIHDDFFEIGGHSLKIMSILVMLKPHYPKLKISDFFTHKTVAELAMRVKELENEVDESNSSKDSGVWEVKDLNEYPNCIDCKIDSNTTAPKNILLTGATGYLGSHILNDLLHDTDAKIYCLIRKSNNQPLTDKLLSTMESYFDQNVIEMVKERAIPVEGDLEKIMLGLSKEDEMFLKENLDTIIHAAADVRHFGDESHFEKVNIQGTKYLLDIATAKKGIRFHYVSTLGIPEDLALSGQWEQVISKENFDTDLKLESVYTNSKLESEKLVYKAGEEGLAINIYRAGNLTCCSETGHFQKNIDNNAFYRMIKAMLLLGKAPTADCYLDFTPINYASKAIVELVRLNNNIGETFHICNPEQILYSSVVEMINNHGYKIELLDQAEYEKWLFDSSIDKSQEGLELAIAQLDGDGVKDSDYRFGCPNTVKYLSSAPFKCAEVNQEFINKMINYAVEIEYFPQA